MRSSRYKTAINHVVIPHGFVLNEGEEVKVAIYSQLEYPEEYALSEKTLKIHGVTVQGKVEMRCLNYKGNISYVIAVPIVSNSMDSNSFISLSDTVYVDQVGFVVSMDFEKPSQLDLTTVQVTTRIIPTESDRCYRIESTFTLPDLITNGSPVQVEEVGKHREAVSNLVKRIEEEKELLRIASVLKRNELDQEQVGIRKNKGGRPRKLDIDKIQKAKELKSNSYSVEEICQILQISKSTLYRYLQNT